MLSGPMRITREPKSFSPWRAPPGGDAPDLLGTTNTLTDQFGTTYTLDPHDLGSGNFLLAPPWNWSLNFEPLRGAAVNSSVFVTMRIRGLYVNAHTDRAASWQLRFKIRELPSLPATIPAPIQLGSDHFTFHPVVATNSRIEFTFTQTGNDPRIRGSCSANRHPACCARAASRGGTPSSRSTGHTDSTRGEEGSSWPTAAKTSEVSIVFASEGPGTYRFTLTAVNGYRVQETFVIGGGA